MTAMVAFLMGPSFLLNFSFSSKELKCSHQSSTSHEGKIYLEIDGFVAHVAHAVRWQKTETELWFNSWRAKEHKGKERESLDISLANDE